MFRIVPLPIIRSLFTVHSAMVYVTQVCIQLLSRTRMELQIHSAMVYVIQVCRQLSNRTRMALLESCLQTCMTYTIAECTVNKLLMMDGVTVRNM